MPRTKNQTATRSAQKTKVRRLVKKDVSEREIARTVGIARNTVDRWKAEFQIEILTAERNASRHFYDKQVAARRRAQLRRTEEEKLVIAKNLALEGRPA